MKRVELEGIKNGKVDSLDYIGGSHFAVFTKKEGTSLVKFRNIDGRTLTIKVVVNIVPNFQ
jgi:hypothetical protein